MCTSLRCDSSMRKGGHMTFRRARTYRRASFLGEPHDVPTCHRNALSWFQCSVAYFVKSSLLSVFDPDLVNLPLLLLGFLSRSSQRELTRVMVVPGASIPERP